MPPALNTLTLSDTKRVLQAGKAKAVNLGIPNNIAVVDVGGALIAFTRRDGALAGSIDLATGKAKTTRRAKSSMRASNQAAHPRKFSSGCTTVIATQILERINIQRKTP